MSLLADAERLQADKARQAARERCTFSDLPNVFGFTYHSHPTALYKTHYGVFEDKTADEFVVIALIRNPRAPTTVPYTPADASHIMLNVLRSNEVRGLLERRGLTPHRAPKDNDEHFRLIELMCGPK